MAIYNKHHVESLNFSIGILPEDIALFHLMYRTSEKGRRELAEQLLDPSDDFEISSTYTSRVAEIFSVILKSLGLRLEFVDDDEVLQELDDDEVKEFEYEGVPYLCTEYQFFLLKRRKSIEKELLHQYGVIDANDLHEKVMQTMRERNYLIGPDKDEYDKVPAFQPDTVSY